MKNLRFRHTVRPVSMVLAAVMVAACWMLLPGCAESDALAALTAGGGGGVGRLAALRETRDRLTAILTEDQRATLKVFREQRAVEREANQAYAESQRALIQSLELSATQREALLSILEAWREDLLSSLSTVIDAKSSLRDAVLAQPPSDDDIVAAADALGTAVGEGALVLTTVIEDCRTVLTVEQAAIVEQVVANQIAYMDDTGGLMARIDTVLALKDELNLTAEQREEIHDLLVTRREEGKRQSLRDRREERRANRADRSDR